MGVRLGIERARELRKRMTAPEAKLWNGLRELRPLGHHFRRQVPLGPYYADFVCHKASLVIEIDGDTHATDEAADYDARRDAFIACEGYRVLRFSNLDVMRNLDGALTIILSALDHTPTLTPSPQGGGKSARRLSGTEEQ